MSNLRVTSLRGRTVGSSPTLPDGAVVTGIVTATSFSGTVAGSTGTFSGVVEIGGDANNGTAEGIELNTSGFLQLSRGSGVSALFAGYTQGSSTQTSRINNNGNAYFLGDVGVGTASPQVKLHLRDTDPYIRLEDSAAPTGYSQIMGTHQGAIAFSADTSNSVADSHLRFDVDGSERLRIDSSGKTGININNPGSYNSAGNELVLGNTGSNGGMTIVSGTGNNGHIFFADGTGTPNQGIIKYEHANDAMAFNTNTGERLRILSGGGITFNGDSAAANALDDYEEGSWTPTNVGATVNSGTFAATGSYTKIGNIVTVQFSQTGGNISWSAGAWLISGLPFAAAIFGSVGSATDTGPSFTSSVMIWTASQFYIQSAGSSITSLRITATYRV